MRRRYRVYYYPYRTGRALLQSPVVFLAVLGGIWAVSSYGWLGSPVGAIRGSIEWAIGLVSSQSMHFSTEATETPAENTVSPEMIVYLRYTLMAVLFFVAAMSRTLWVAIALGLGFGAIFHPELVGNTLFVSIADQTTEFIKNLIAPLRS